MRKTNFFVTAIVVASFFVMTLVYMSLTGDVRGNTKASQDRLAQDKSFAVASIAENIAPTEAPTATPTPTSIPVFIPGFDEIPSEYSIDELSNTPTGFTVTENETGFSMEWSLVIGADYYILCTSDDGTVYHPVQIFWGSMYRWELMEKTAAGLMILAFSDESQEGTEDDVMLKAYRYIPITPTPTPTQAPQAPRATATPKPTKVPMPSPTPKPPSQYKIIVDKADRAFAVFSIDENGQYTNKVVTYPAALGSGKKTPSGTWAIGAKEEWHSWGSQYSPYTSSYRSGLYFHAPLYYSKSFDNLNADYYNGIGLDGTGPYYYSGGCVRTTVAGARFVYYNCAGGTVVEIVSSSDLVSYPGKPPIDPDYPTWDPTDTGKPAATPTPTPEVTPEVTPEITPEPTATPAPTATPSPTPSPTPTATPTPTVTPIPTATPTETSAPTTTTSST